MKPKGAGSIEAGSIGAGSIVRRSGWGAIAAAGLLLAVAGCGSSTAATSSNSSPAQSQAAAGGNAAPAPGLCKFMTSQEASQALGTTMVVGLLGPGACTVKAANGDTSKTATLTSVPSGGRAVFDQTKAADDQDLPGVGDAAICHQGQNNAAALVVKGDVLLEVASLNCDTASKLARLAAPRL